MADVRYQVFVSSTFRDLEEERKAVLNAILEMSHFPAGMEMFPASDGTAWEVIEAVIRESDYYVLIVGGKYGSTDVNGISYTEREYDCAIEHGIPVLAFLHGNPGNIPGDKLEMNGKAKTRLDKFRKKVEKAHHRRTWTSALELQCRVTTGLSQEIRKKPRVGWVRADGVDNQELQKRLIALQERYDDLEYEFKKAASLRDDVDENLLKLISSDDDTYEIQFRRFTIHDTLVGAFTFCVTWNQIFYWVARKMTAPITNTEVRSELNSMIRESGFGSRDESSPQDRVYIDEECFEQITIQLRAMGLIEIVGARNPYQTSGSYPSVVDGWKLTKRGERRMLAKEALRRSEF